MDVLRSEIRQSIRQSDSHPAVADDPWEVDEWLRRREAALKDRDELAAIEREIAEVRDSIEHAKRLLVQALADVKVAFNADADITALTSFAEDALSAFHASANAAIQVEMLRTEVAERRHALEAVKDAATAWSTDWETVCGGCWLREIGQAPNVGAVAEILTVLERLSSAVEAREGLVDRIQKMEKDKVSFETRVHELCASLDLATDGTPLALCQAVFEKIKSAGLDAERLEKLKRDLDNMRRDEHALNVAQDLLVARVTQMLEFFAVATLEEVESGIDLAARHRDLANAIAEAEQELLQITGRGSVAEVEEMTASIDRSELEEELAKLAPVLDDQDARCREVFHSRSKAQDALDEIGGDAKVATLEEQRRTTLLEIEESARRYMEVRAGGAATEQALKRYRDRHRSGMMARASDAFRTISRGAYQGVAAQPGKDGDVLIAVSASGGSKAANELSKGARFQLYLALRVAGYHEFVANRTPIPFIADDIMETFDDFRAEEAFRLFAEMGMHGQVIYLTHHRHLTEIARKVCPNVRLHDLEEVGKSATLHVVAAE
ncbi:ATP-binding protein [Rhizobium sp. P32RR-XVIII]|uniref:ATP-binding protein n=1 Tax=Rhizobium sp. P32RR-XVIII TaxID=2726738 RepID=UPI001FEE6E89|nr:hypothetical protein [Rhizobium sp. P32RR-XVIII]